MKPDHYNTLGLDPGCDEAVIREVYLALMRQYHPDKNSSSAAAARVRAITAAYAVLGDPNKRLKYDRARVPILTVDEPPNRQPPKPKSNPPAWSTAAAALRRRASTAANPCDGALQPGTQSTYAPARWRSAKVVASQQTRRLKLTLANLLASAATLQRNVVTAAGTALADLYKPAERDAADARAKTGSGLGEDNFKTGAPVRSNTSPQPAETSPAPETCEGRPPALAGILSNESDRAAVILVVSLAEGLLAERIVEAMPQGDEQRDALLRPGGALSSFKGKAAIGQALGIISGETAKNLEVLDRMRTICAYSKLDVSLWTRELQDLFCLLLAPDAVEFVRTATNREFPRQLFNVVAAYQFELLLGASPAQAQQFFDEMLSATFDPVSDEIGR